MTYIMSFMCRAGRKTILTRLGLRTVGRKTLRGMRLCMHYLLPQFSTVSFRHLCWPQAILCTFTLTSTNVL